MSRMPSTIEFEITTIEQPPARDESRTTVWAGFLAALQAVQREIVMRAALWRMHRMAAADPRFFADIGVSPGSAERLVRRGRDRR